MNSCKSNSFEKIMKTQLDISDLLEHGKIQNELDFESPACRSKIKSSF